MRKWIAALSVAAVTLAFMVPVQGQTLSDQVLLLLARANSWTGAQTFNNVTITGTCTGCGTAGSGTVTSVAITAAPTTVFDIVGSPITGAGTLVLSMDSQTANTVLTGPTTGSAAAPAFRALIDDDIPDTITIAGTNTVTWASVNKSGSSLANLATRSAADLATGSLALARLTDSGTANLPLVSGGSGGDPVYEALDLTTATVVTGQLVAASFPTLTGDITTAGGALATTLANSGVTAATYGSASIIPILTVDAKGRVTVGNSATVSAVTLLNASRHSDTADNPATRGSLVYGNTSNLWDELLVGTSGYVLHSNGTDVGWSNDGTGLNVSMTNATAGILALARGGTAAGLTASAGSVTYGTATGMAFSAVGSTGECLESRGTGAPVWATCASGGGGGGNHAILSSTHTDSSAAAVSRGSVIVGNSSPAWVELTIGSTVGSFLRSDGTDVVWGVDGSALTQLSASNIASGTLSTTRLPTIPVATGGTGLTAYTVGDLLTASTATTLASVTAPAAGQVLASAGAGVVPAYSSTLLTTAVGVGIGGEAVSSTTFLAIEASTSTKSHLRLTEGANKTGSLVEGDIWYDGSNFKGYNASGSVTLDVQSSSGGGFTDDGAVVRLTAASDTLGVGTTSTSAKVDIVSTSAQLELAYDGSNNLTFAVGSDGETVIGGAGSGNRVVLNDVPLAFEGATANAYETTFVFTDPTADRTITFPDGNVTIGSSAVTISGTPANNQLAVWTSATALEGETSVTWDETTFSALGNLVVGTTGGATHTMTFTTSHATDPVLTASSGALNLSAGAMQVAGNAVADAADTLAHFAATTSDQLRGVISNETGSGGGLVFATSPTLTTPALGAATGTSLVASADVSAGGDFKLTTNNKFYYGENTSGAARQAIGMDNNNKIVIAGNADATAIQGTLDIASSLETGSGNVALIGTDGKIEGPLSSTIIDNLSGANLTALTAGNINGVIPVANLGTGSASSSVFLRGDGAWTSVTTGAAGSDHYVQYNNAGAMAGNSAFIFNDSTDAVTIAGTSASSLDIGGGLNAGTGNVALIGTDGKLEGPLSSTIIDNLSGANLTSLPAGQLTGTIDNARLPTNVAVGGTLGATGITTLSNRLLLGGTADTTAIDGGDTAGVLSTHTSLKVTANGNIHFTIDADGGAGGYGDHNDFAIKARQSTGYKDLFNVYAWGSDNSPTWRVAFMSGIDGGDILTQSPRIDALYHFNVDGSGQLMLIGKNGYDDDFNTFKFAIPSNNAEFHLGDPNDENDPGIYYYSGGGSSTSGEYGDTGKWDIKLGSPGIGHEGKGNGQLRAAARTFMIRGPATNYANTPDAGGGATTGNRAIVFQTCSVAACDNAGGRPDDADSTSFIMHLEDKSGMLFGTDNVKFDPARDGPTKSRMKLSSDGLINTLDNGSPTDNRSKLGTSTHRWAEVNAVLVNGSDFGFRNNFALTEGYNLGDDLPPGIGIVSDRGEESKLVAYIAEDGTIYANDFKSLDDLMAQYNVLVKPRAERVGENAP